MQFQVVTFVYDSFKPPPQLSQMYVSLEVHIAHVCDSDLLLHTSYNCDAVGAHKNFGAHDVCLTIHLRSIYEQEAPEWQKPLYHLHASIGLNPLPVSVANIRVFILKFVGRVSETQLQVSENSN